MPIKKTTKNEKAKLDRETLSDSYIINLLRRGIEYKKLGLEWEFTSNDFKKHKELIECKRMQIKIARLIKERKNEKKKA